MQAVEITHPGGPGVLRLGERPMPVPGAGEVLIRVSASGVNRPDVLQRKGNYCLGGCRLCGWRPGLRAGGGRWLRPVVRGTHCAMLAGAAGLDRCAGSEFA